MISFIVAARNDNYGSKNNSTTFLERFHKALSVNLENINSFNIPYEYLIVEWSPVKEYLILEKTFKKLFDNNKNVKDIIVTPSVSINDGLNPTRFYEFFAKNVGIRQAKFDNVIILNSDIVIPYYAMSYFVKLVIDGYNKLDYFRPLIRSSVSMNLQYIERYKIDCPNEPRLKACGSYPGDLFLANKETLIEKAQGFDETSIIHRSYNRVQRGMDSEIMWNLHLNGCSLQYFDCDYFHIEHEHGTNDIFDTDIWEFNRDGYENRENWGYINYNKTEVSDQLIIIS